MEEEAKPKPKPMQTPASSASGCGTQKKSKVAEQAESPSMKLGIGIGVPVIKQEKRHLTPAQLDEFQRQLLIYKYIAAGLPVPSSLVRPIWKSVNDSLRFVNGVSGIHRQYPSFVGFSKEFDYRNMMDPEPERCRRTDGKKWRCKKGVIPGQKYCEQHMHRGRRRSRKPVESFQTIPTSYATPIQMHKPSTNLENSNANSFYSATNPSDTSIYHKNSGATSSSNVDFKITGANMTTSSVSKCIGTSTSIIRKRTLGLINAAAIMTTCTLHTDSTVTTATIGTDKGVYNNYCKSSSVDETNGNCGKYIAFKNQIDRGNGYRNINNSNVGTSQRLNFSPKSVLQVQGSNSGCLLRSGELEPRRCRRTDGKKWRCRRDVVPNEKYCKMHMHRGAKKCVLANQSPAVPQATPHSATSSGLNPKAVLPSKADSSNLNTNLSISIAANPHQTKDDTSTSYDGDTTSSSSDTISDTMIANNDYKDVSSFVSE